MRVPGVFATDFEPEGQPVGTAVVVPGRGYPPAAPLSFFAGFVLLRHGWSVRQVWWDPPDPESDEETMEWVRGQVENALPTAGRVLIVGKSLGTLSAPVAAERGHPAVWFTPILGLPAIADALAANPAPQLLVGGTADALWDSAVARDLAGRGCVVLEVPDADHVLMAPGDPVRGVEMHVEVVRTLDVWLAGLGAG
ncbi:MAG: alpha/beta hydrolase [Nocardioides sp.]|nr:alpha/beta hydrolase [Nocardioides sp.]